MSKSLKIEVLVEDIISSGVTDSLFVSKQQYDSDYQLVPKLDSNGKINITLIPDELTSLLDTLNDQLVEITRSVSEAISTANQYTDNKLSKKADLNTTTGKIRQSQLPLIEEYSGFQDYIQLNVYQKYDTEVQLINDKLNLIGDLGKKADLGTDGKVLSSQLPDITTYPGYSSAIQNLQDFIQLNIEDLKTAQDQINSDINGLLTAIQSIFDSPTAADVLLPNGQLVPNLSKRIGGMGSDIANLKTKTNFKNGGQLEPAGTWGVIGKIQDGNAAEIPELNTQAKVLLQMLNDVRKNGGVMPFDQTFANLIDGFDIGDRVKLNNGEVVVSTTIDNKTDPNSDMTGWKISKQIDLLYSSEIGIINDGIFDNRNKFINLNSLNKNVVLREGDYYISGDLTISFRSLKLLDGARFIVQEGKTLTIDCPLYLSNSDHFNTIGRVKLTKKCKLSHLKIEWWGGVNDNLTDCYPPIQKLFDSVYYGTFPRKMQFYCGVYAFSNKFVTPDNFYILGAMPINHWYTPLDDTSFTVLRGYGNWVGYHIEITALSVIENCFSIGSNTFGEFNTKLQGGILISGVSAQFKNVSGAYWGLEGLKVTGGIVYGEIGYWNNCCTAGKNLDGSPLSSYQGCVTINGTDNCIRGVHGGSISDEPTATGWIVGVLFGGGSSGRFSDIVGENADYGMVINTLYGMFVNMRPERCAKNALIINGEGNTLTNTKVGMQVGTSDIGNIDAIIVNGSNNKIYNVISDIYNKFRHFIVDNRTSLGEGDATYGNQYFGLPSYLSNNLPPNITGQLLKHQGSAIYSNTDRNTGVVINSDFTLDAQLYSYIRILNSSPKTLNKLLNGIVGQRIMISTPSNLTINDVSNGNDCNIKTKNSSNIVIPSDGFASFIKSPNGYWLQEF